MCKLSIKNSFPILHIGTHRQMGMETTRAKKETKAKKQKKMYKTNK